MKTKAKWLALPLFLAACSLINSPEELVEPGSAAGSGGTNATSGSAVGGTAGEGEVVGGNGGTAGDGTCFGSECQSAGQSGSGAGGDPNVERVCVPLETVCKDAGTATCNEDGTGYASETECSATQSCADGACIEQQCKPETKFCSVGAIRECALDGLSSTEVELCGTGKYCDEESATCKTGTCAPNAPACDGDRATTCNAEGSGYVAGGETCGASTTCNSGECKAHVCTPNGKACSAKNVVTCAADGLSSTVTATCSGGTPFCVSGVCKPCEPNELRCNGQQPQKCGASGDWANSGAACSGDKSCDVEGTRVCSTSPTVPGGTFNRANDAMSPATLSSFRLDRYEVTVARFRAFVTAAIGGYRPASGAGKHTHLNAGKGVAIGTGFEAGWDTTWNSELARADLAAWTTELSCHGGLATWTQTAGANEAKPINCANWWQAYAFCIWDGGFLPSDAEWNYAAAGGAEQRLYPWGTTAPGTDASLSVYNCEYMNVGSPCTGSFAIAPTGSAPAGDSRWRHADLSGNIAEWVMDYGLPKPCTNCASPVSNGPTARGGYFASSSATDVTTTARPGAPPDLNNPTIGFRCARLP